MCTLLTVPIGPLWAHQDLGIAEQAVPMSLTTSLVNTSDGRWLLMACAALAFFALLLFHRRRAALHVRRRFVSDLLDHLPVSLLVVSPEGRIDFMDHATRQRLQLDPDQTVEGGDYRNLVSDGIRRGVITATEHTTAELERMLTVDALRDGAILEKTSIQGRAIRIETRRLPDKNLLLIHRDITEEKRTLDQIRASREALIRQVRLENFARAELHDFAYATSHDLRSPLNTIQMLTEELSDELSPKQKAAQDLVKDIDFTTRRALMIIDGVREYMSSIKDDAKFQIVDLDAILDKALDTFATDPDTSDTIISREPLGKVWGDRDQLEILMRNLLSNGHKFRSQHHPARIAISPLKTGSGMVGFSIRDNGIGIAEKYQQKIFKAFMRLHSFGEYPGAGLGLANCRRIVENHFGRIRIFSEPDHGTQISISLPEKPDALHQKNIV